MPDDELHEIRSGVVADWSDHRDADFTPTSDLPPPPALELVKYRELAEETWHQRGEECTGFALAAIANYLIRRQHDGAELPSVSRRMLYEMAQQYDGAMHVEGSTLRGALKGWSRVGVASDQEWPYHPGDEHGAVHGTLNLRRILDGRTRPLMGYRRIKGHDIEVMQRALAEGHPLYVASKTHAGWYRLFLHNSSHEIERSPQDRDRGIHAFVIMGYNKKGFVLHNSWGPEWGEDGYAHLPYDQWKWGATDTWVVHAGIDADPIPVPAEPAPKTAKRNYREMWQHLIVLDDHGQLASSGLYEMDEGSVKTMLYLFDEFTRREGWTNRKLAIVADDGSQPIAATLERLGPLRDQLMRHQIYPIFLLWQTSWRAGLEHELATWKAHRSADQLPEDVGDKVAAGESRAAALWDAIRGRSIQACTSPTGGARLLAQSIAYKRGQRGFGLHGVSFGAGDILLAPLTTLLPGPVDTTLAVAPASTMHDFDVTYRQAIVRGLLQQLTVVPATDWLTSLVGDVWSLQGATRRQAARDSRVTKKWLQEPVPILGSLSDLESSASIDHFRGLGAFEIDDRDPSTWNQNELVDLIIGHITAAPSTTVGAVGSGLPRDPLTRAQLLRRSLG